MATRTSRRFRPARLDRSQLPLPTNAVATSTLVSTKWQLDFNNAVQVVALPTDFLVNGQPATAFVQNTPTRVTLTFAVNVTAGQTWTIPTASRNIRTPTGGYVVPATGTF